MTRISSKENGPLSISFSFSSSSSHPSYFSRVYHAIGIQTANQRLPFLLFVLLLIYALNVFNNRKKKFNLNLLGEKKMGVEWEKKISN